MGDAVDGAKPAVAFAMRGPAAVVTADLDGDGAMDLAILDMSAAQVVVWLGDGGIQLPAGRAARERLTRRETEVAALLEAGYTDCEIGTVLRISRRTAETHSANVRAKFGVRSRRELIRGRFGKASSAEETT